MNACYVDFGSLLLLFLIQKVLPGGKQLFLFLLKAPHMLPGPATQVFNSQVYDP